ncbi:MAG: glycosyltransferase involved in cell wall biosynthesis, partial [Myxococcota bacterium]
MSMILLVNAHGGQRGGSQRSIRSIGIALRNAGHDVQFACPTGPWLRGLSSLGFVVHPLERSAWMGGKLEQAGAGNLWRLGRLARSVDIVHTFQYGSYLLARAATATVDTAHVHTILGPLSPGHRFARTDRLVSVSLAFAADAVLAGAEPACVTVIPNRVALDEFGGLGDPSGTRITLISRLEGHLAHAAAHFVEASNRLVGHEFVVAGDGPAADALRSAGRATFLGHVDDIVGVHADAAIVVGVGRTLLEGMASGLPCICLGPTGFGGVVSPDTIVGMAAHNMSGRHRFKPSPDGLTDAINDLMADRPKRQMLGRFGQAWVREHYDIRSGI